MKNELQISLRWLTKNSRQPVEAAQFFVSRFADDFSLSWSAVVVDPHAPRTSHGEGAGGHAALAHRARVAAAVRQYVERDLSAAPVPPLI